MSGLLIAAPSSGSGKTTLTLGLLRALRDRGVDVAPGKAGPDYIDPAFHAAASGKTCFNFDPWGMRPSYLTSLAASHGAGRHFIVEAMMGLYDGAADGSGAPADLAALLGLSVVLVVDCARISHSVAALVSGYRGYRSGVSVEGVILNRVGSTRHEAMLRQALDGVGMPIFGVVYQDALLQLPERHLGLVQAGEHATLETFISHAADVVARCCNLDALQALSVSGGVHADHAVASIPPLGNRIAVARDQAFAFSYAHLLEGWRAAGSEIEFFSPLADEGPSEACDAVYLPGGYPELHAGRLAANAAFRKGMADAAARDAAIYGECGGYMVLGDGLIDAGGARHAMLGLLPLVTSFAARKRHLGLRTVTPLPGSPFAEPMRAHEFHYSTVVEEGQADRLFTACDAAGEDMGTFGLRRGNVAGSYLHLIDLAEAQA